jgi:uncharacterized protein YvpB
MSIRRLLQLWLVFIFVVLIPAQSVRADPIPARAYVKGVEGHRQSLSLSCESRSAVDWAAYWGIKIGERKFLARLPRSKNPDKGFVGNPNDAWGSVPPASYGVHAQPVADLLQEYGLQAEARRNMSWEDLQREIVAGRPVIVWIIGQMWEGNPVAYTAPDRHKTIVAPYEHTMILIGYEPGKVYVVDAYTGWTQSYPLRNFMRSWRTLGRMAVTGSAAAPVPATEAVQETEVPISPSVYLPFVLRQVASEVDSEQADEKHAQTRKTYTVRRGDYLAGVARRFGVNWRVLAQLNGINDPYVIYAGQVLKIP